MNAIETAPAAVRVGRRVFDFESYEATSAAYRATIEATGVGGSRAPKCDILDGAGRVVAYVSYNGRVWRGNRLDWKSGDVPLYDNRVSA